MKRTAGRLALFFTLLGLAASLVAAWIHFHVLRDPGYTSFCDVNSTISCTEVYQSRFGTFAGIPVALFGALFFAVTTLLVIGGLRAEKPARQNVPGYLFALSTVGLAVVFYLGYASFFVLKALCLLCLTTYVAVIGLFIVSGAATDVPMSGLPRRAVADLKTLRRSPLAVALILVVAAGAGLSFAFFPRPGTTVMAAGTTKPAISSDQESAFEQWFTAQPHEAVPVPRDGAKVLVVKFNDYQCPPCRHAYESYKGIFARYAAEDPGKVRLVYLDYPLDSSCNPNVLGGGPHPSACDAAVAVRLAAARGKKKAMQEWLFGHQPELSASVIRAALKRIAGVTDFDAKYPEVIKKVQADIAVGHRLGVQATPTFFINGIKVVGGLSPRYFDAAIAYELKHAAPAGH